MKNDPTLPAADKPRQITNTGTALTNANTVVDAATDADHVDSAFNDGIIAIDKAHVPGATLDAQRQAKKDALDTAAATVKQAIQDDATFTSAEKKIQTDAVDKALTDGKAAIDKAMNADDINTAADTALTNINSAHKPGPSLADQRTQQKQALQTKHDQVVNEINLDPTLTSTEKNDQIKKADQALTDGNKAIDDAVTADAIIDAATIGQQAIEKAHETGTPIDDQKNTQRKRLNAEATAVKQKIQDDVTLTTAEKTKQTANVDTALADGLKNINDATTADAINAAGDKGIADIDGMYKTGTPLDKQKTDQKQAIDAEAAKIKKDIQNDPTLTATEKTKQSGDVDKAAEDGKKAVDAATNADAIITAASGAIKNIDDAHLPGKSLDDQRNAKKAEIDKAATDAKKTIQDDPTLTTAEKNPQLDAVDKAVTDGKIAIDAATDADGINKAGDAAINVIGSIHQPGKPLAEQRDAKKAEIDTAAANAKKAIQDDPTLTTKEKNEQIAVVDKAVTKGKAAIDAATDADGINKAGDAAIDTINKTHQPSKSIAEQQAAQKQAIADEAAKVKKDIQNDPTLTTTEKNNQSGDVDKAAQDAVNAIDKATTADDINKAFDTGKTNIDNAHQPGTSLDKQKENQKKALQDEAAKIKQAIQDDPTLTTAQKQQQTDDVDQALKDGIATIDKATNADDVNKAFDAGKKNIDDAYHPGQTLDEQKAAQKKALEDEAAKVKQAIQDDPTLTTVEKQNQTTDADKALKDGTDAIDKATNADDINKAFDTGKTNIDNAHQPGTAIDDQKTAQKKSLKDEAAKVKQDIQDDPTLTTAEKQKQTDDVDQALKDGTAAIDKATNADDINKAFDTGKINIDNAHRPGQSVDDQKEAQKQFLDDEAAKVKQAIQDDPTLTTAEKQQQSADVDKALKDGNAAIDAANNADDISKAFDTGKINIDNAHRPGTAIDEQKAAQKKHLAEEAAKVSQEIQDDPTLTTPEKQQQTADVDQAYRDGEAAIDAATNADDINKAFDTGKINIDNAHQPGKAIADQKDAQKKHLAEEAAKVKQEIQDDPTLTTTEKQKQTADVDQAYKDGEAAIDAATTADDINKAFDTGKTNIDNAHQPGTALDDHKAAQKKSLAEEAAKVKQEIQDDPTLTTAEKQKQAADVDQAYKNGEAAIDAATNTDDINKAFDTGKVNIDNAHKPGTAIDDQKAAQKKFLDEEATKVKQAIQDDPTLTTAEKQRQTENVDKALKDGNAAIDAATNADDINKAFDTGKINIDNAHQPGAAIDDQKASQKKHLAEEAAKVKQEIQDDPTLTTAEKQKQAADVDQAYKDGEAAIDAATTADDINKAFDTGKVNIDNAHKPGTAVDDQKAAQKKQLAEEADKVKQAIQDDSTLTTAEKKQQSENVDKALVDGQRAIDQASDADSINTAFVTGKANINTQHQPGKSLADQRQAAVNEIDKEAAKVKQQIDNDPLLTEAEKATQKARVDHEAALAKEALAKAGNADELNAALADGIKNIDAQYVPGTQKAPDPKPTPAPLPGDPRPTSTQPLSTSRTSTSSLPRTSDKPATGLAALGAFLLSMFGFALTGKKRKRS
ncbi:matrix-binding protein [Lacticaseibacillus chiayiensis]|nr:matrix-binding protein [Lacticaseibacillus chiayiensis]